MNIHLSGYTFRFWLVTESNRYEPEDFELLETPSGWRARSTQYSYGEGSGRVAGEFQVNFERTPAGIAWQAQAGHAEPIQGVRVALEPLPAGMVLLPFEEIDLKADEPGRCFIYPNGYYPIRHISSTGTQPASGPVRDWAAPFALFQDGPGWLALSGPEYPPRLKKIWLYRQDDHQVIYLYSEEDACRRKTTYHSPTWRIESAPGWQEFVTGYSDWMAGAFGLRPFAERAATQPWLKEISLVVILHGISHDGKICHTYAEMAERVEALARKFPANQTIFKLPGFEGNIDRHWPDALPAERLGGEEGFRRLVDTAHRLGAKIIPHLNVWGSSFENPRTRALLEHQIHDQQDRPSTWSYDIDQDEVAEEIMAYISPDAEAWRKVQLENVGGLVARGVDAIYLDQTGTFINDRRHDHFRGLQTLYRELREAFPATQFAGEAPMQEITASLVSLVCGISTVRTARLAEMFRLLFLPYLRQYGYNLPPEPYRGVWGAPTQVREDWSRERFLQYEERAERVHGIPSLNLTDRRINLDSDLVEGVLERARRYKIVENQ